MPTESMARRSPRRANFCRRAGRHQVVGDRGQQDGWERFFDGVEKALAAYIEKHPEGAKDLPENWQSTIELARAEIEDCCISLSGRPKRPPALLLARLRPYLAPAPAHRLVGRRAEEALQAAP